jgi:glyoxylase I family protein
MELVRPHLHHVAITVKDFEVSVPWYSQVFDISLRMEGPHDGGHAKLLADENMELVIVLHVHDENDGRTFSERRTGLDHVGFGVPTRAELVEWQSKLEGLGVERAEVTGRPLTQSPISDQEYGAVLVFRDPDNIQLEFFAPPGT